MKLKENLLSESIEEDQPPSQVRNLSNTGFPFVGENELTPIYPHLYQNTLTNKQKNYYESNEHALPLKSLVVKIETDINTCHKLWKEFSPNETVFDNWNFRLAFLKGYKRTPYFILLKRGQENVALLPLWYEDDKERFTWFGSDWQEENKFFTKEPLLIPVLLALSPSPIFLNAISANIPYWTKDVIKLSPDDPKYILDLTNFSSSENYLESLKKKKRYNLKRDRNKIQSLAPKIIIDNFQDIDKLIKLNIRRFKQKGENSSLEDQRSVETFRQVIKLGNKKDSYQTRMITVVIDGKVAGVDLITIFKNCYAPLKCGYDVDKFPGIGSFVNLLEIDDAISLGMEKIDFLEIGYGWKDKWFTEVPLFKYEK